MPIRAAPASIGPPATAAEGSGRLGGDRADPFADQVETRPSSQVRPETARIRDATAERRDQDADARDAAASSRDQLAATLDAENERLQKSRAQSADGSPLGLDPHLRATL
jgi:hypothetical protein